MKSFETKSVAPVEVSQSTNSQPSRPEVPTDAGRFGDHLTDEQLKDRAMRVRSDFFLFYYAMLETEVPQIAKKLGSSTYPRRCLKIMYDEVQSYSREEILDNLEAARTKVDFETFIKEPTEQCLKVLLEMSPEILTSEEQKKLAQVNFFISAEQVQNYLKSKTFRKILRDKSPDNLLLKHRFAALLASRKRPQAPTKEAKPTPSRDEDSQSH